MLLTLMRRAAGRAALAAVGRAIAVDPVPTKHRRSRMRHLRNGIGTLTVTSSRAAWRPNLALSLFYLTRSAVRPQLRYGFRELGRALAPPDDVPKRTMLALAVVPSIAAAAAIAARARPRTAELPERRFAPPPPVPARVAG